MNIYGNYEMLEWHFAAASGQYSLSHKYLRLCVEFSASIISFRPPTTEKGYPFAIDFANVVKSEFLHSFYLLIPSAAKSNGTASSKMKA